MSLIYFIITLLLILLFFVMLIFSVALRIKFIIDSNNSDLNLSVFWLYPFLRVLIAIENEKPMLTVFIFKTKVFKKAVKAQKGKANQGNLMQLANPTDINVTTSYGFKDLYLTGVVCGVVNMIQGFINARYVHQYPNFTGIDDYVYVNATAKVNIGSAIVNFTKSKIKNY